MKPWSLRPTEQCGTNEGLLSTSENKKYKTKSVTEHAVLGMQFHNHYVSMPHGNRKENHRSAFNNQHLHNVEIRRTGSFDALVTYR